MEDVKSSPDPPVQEGRPTVDRLIATLSLPLTGTAYSLVGMPWWIVVLNTSASGLWLVFRRGAPHALEWSDVLRQIRDTWRRHDGGPGP